MWPLKALLTLMLFLLFDSHRVLAQNSTENTTAIEDTRPVINLLWFWTQRGSPHGRGLEPTAEIVMDDINSNAAILPDYRLNLISVKTRYEFHKSSNASLIALVREIYVGEKVHMTIGPLHTVEAEPVASLAPNWNIISMCYGASSGTLSDADAYPLFFRTSMAQNEMISLSIAMFKYFGYTRVFTSYLEVTTALTYRIQEERELGEAGITVRSAAFRHQPSRTIMLNKVQESDYRIISVVFGERYTRRMVCEAYHRGMSSDRYLYIFYRITTHNWWLPNVRGEDETQCTLDELEEAFHGSFRIIDNELDPEDATMVTGYRSSEFLQRLQGAIAARWPDSPQTDPLPFFLYDAITAAALALNNSEGAGGKTLLEFDYDSVEMRERFMEELFKLDFAGASGRIKFLGNGDRNIIYRIEQFRRELHGFKTVGYYFQLGDRLVWREELQFGTPDGQPPPDFVQLNFFDRPANVAAVVLLAILVVGVPLGIAIARHRIRKSAFEATLATLQWRIKPEEISKGIKGKRSFASSMFSLSNTTLQGDFKRGGGGATTSSHLPQPFTSAELHGDPILLFNVNTRANQPIAPNRQLLIELKTMNELTHDNLARFLGVVQAPVGQETQVKLDGNAIVYENGAKGTLHEVLVSDQIELDASFKYSLLSDVASGLACLHRSPIGRHGRVRSTCCVIDSRFVTKITDYGLPMLQDNAVYMATAEEEDLLWMAPELLRLRRKVIEEEGSGLLYRQADVYSFAIIISEALCRTQPYDYQLESLSITELVERLQALDVNDSTCTRPHPSAEVEAPASLTKLMEQCWAETPSERPAIKSVVEQLRRAMSAEGLSGNITENVLKRVERYAQNLEQLVQEHVAAFFEEKRRAEQLLYSILPRSVADRLKVGEQVEPEAFHSVSIYFSDIVGFTTISAGSTPFEIVKLLNDLYTLFDGILARYDVYKVETIGDAYMVASGLPIRNGIEHARQIALMSLALMEGIGLFRMAHRPDEVLRLRIGLHTGPCAAGVVGLVMPRYCLFGDTVNTASRMESTGEPLRIHVSETLRKLLVQFDDQFRIEHRGTIEVKGKGEMSTHWLTAT